MGFTITIMYEQQLFWYTVKSLASRKPVQMVSGVQDHMEMLHLPVLDGQTNSSVGVKKKKKKANKQSSL